MPENPHCSAISLIRQTLNYCKETNLKAPFALQFIHVILHEFLVVQRNLLLVISMDSDYSVDHRQQ